MDFAWWHWLLLGVVLMGIELRLGALFVCWFGAGAWVVAGVLYAFPGATFGAQVFLWLTASMTLVWTWFQIFRR
ncbi:hypothetical protein OTERR_15660 [Oryzomicrobium terrae]|uniref:NfeD-like C-terminal domain-containing protein n=1 Tax=Oryzomicrobium terrae TaxID=1735038 RepID=A0A5C1E7V9_9RHOO|nr:hypothetical protein [Oryzomicrobium terrae]QEL65042.1 hypothetical protein OTERR_15660 [Oryzomicrobium terrae]